MTQQANTAVFLVRAWWEDGQFRARVSYYVDISSEAGTQIVTADPAELHRQLAVWLDKSIAVAES